MGRSPYDPDDLLDELLSLAWAAVCVTGWVLTLFLMGWLLIRG